MQAHAPFTAAAIWAPDLARQEGAGVLRALSDHAMPILPGDPLQQKLDAFTVESKEPGDQRLPLLQGVRHQVHYATASS